MILTVKTVAKATKGRDQAVKILEEAAEVFEARDALEDEIRFLEAGEVADAGCDLADEIADLVIAACGLAESWDLDLTRALARKVERRGGSGVRQDHVPVNG